LLSSKERREKRRKNLGKKIVNVNLVKGCKNVTKVVTPKAPRGESKKGSHEETKPGAENCPMNCKM